MEVGRRTLMPRKQAANKHGGAPCTLQCIAVLLGLTLGL